MKTSDANAKPALGFLTIIENVDLGLLGGYLVLNAAGRPLEFHCTAPVKPNRAQQILYGPTLEPFLYGEQIGQTLVAKSAITPLALCTDREPALSIREFVDFPVALVLPAEPEADLENPPAPVSPDDAAGVRWRIDGGHGPSPGLVTFRLGQNRLALPVSEGEDRARLVDRLGVLAESFDLAEPFGRIREAIEEARRGGQ